jgi:hypothetical protein
MKDGHQQIDYLPTQLGATSSFVDHDEMPDDVIAASPCKLMLMLQKAGDMDFQKRVNTRAIASCPLWHLHTLPKPWYIVEDTLFRSDH